MRRNLSGETNVGKCPGYGYRQGRESIDVAESHFFRSTTLVSLAVTLQLNQDEKDRYLAFYRVRCVCPLVEELWKARSIAIGTSEFFCSTPQYRLVSSVPLAAHSRSAKRQCVECVGSGIMTLDPKFDGKSINLESATPVFYDYVESPHCNDFPSRADRHKHVINDQIETAAGIANANSRWLEVAIVIVLDLIAVTSAMGLTALIFGFGTADYGVSIKALVVMIGIFALAGLYENRNACSVQRLRTRVTGITAFSVLILLTDGILGHRMTLLMTLIQAGLLLAMCFYAENILPSMMQRLGLKELGRQELGRQELGLQELGRHENVRARPFEHAKPAESAAKVLRDTPRPPSSNAMGTVKRVVDIAVAMPALIALSPLIGVLALIIKSIDRGPAFFTQTRIGYNERLFQMFKLRSMYLDAESRLECHLRESPSARVEWERFYKLKNDPRVLPYVGNFIRRTSLDELPQFLNVVMGDMSLVGPRPFPAYHVRRFDREFQALRASVPPGITGFWQISSRSDGDIKAQQEQDALYVLHRSLWLDLYILLQTVPAVINARGAR